MATRIDLVLDQGSTFEFQTTVLDASGDELDLSDYTVRAQMRRHYTSTNSYAFTANTYTPDEVENGITISMTAAQTANIAPGRYVYDVEMVTGSTVTRVCEGVVTVTPEVTR